MIIFYAILWDAAKLRVFLANFMIYVFYIFKSFYIMFLTRTFIFDAIAHYV